jgi:hypothetical protein
MATIADTHPPEPRNFGLQKVYPVLDIDDGKKDIELVDFSRSIYIMLMELVSLLSMAWIPNHHDSGWHGKRTTTRRLEKSTG